MRAIANKTLPAQRDNRNRWLISREDLKAWSVFRPVYERTEPDTDRPVLDHDRTVLADLAAARAEIQGLRDRLADTQADRDRLAALLEKALEPRPGIIARLFQR